MAPTTSKPPQKRKAPSFKPPRPVSKSTKTSKPSAPRRASAPSTTKKRGRPSLINDQASASDNDEEDADDDDDDEFPPSATLVSESSETELPVPTSLSTQDPFPSIPPALLTRLLHHHFSKDGNIRIGKEAEGVVGKYMETFVREAIARAAFERAETRNQEKHGRDEGRGKVGEDFLDVEDLEKLAPQMMLDF